MRNALLLSCMVSALSLADIRLSDAAAAIDSATTYLPRGTVTQFWACADEEILISGPAGTGKSRGILEWIHFVLQRYPGARALIVRKTRTSLNESGLFTYEEQVLTQPERGALVGARSRETRQKYVYPNSSELVAGGLDKPTRLFSTEYDLIYVQEAQETALDEWESFMRALRNGVVPYQQLVGDCNPDKPTHPLKKRADEGGLTMLHARHTDNPRLWDEACQQWTPYGAGYLAKLRRLTGARKKRLLHGQWAGSEGMVFEAWDEGVHLVAPREWASTGPPKDWRRFRAIDFGYTNPFVCQWWAQDPDGRLFLYREIYRTKTLVRDHAAEIARLSVHADGTPERIEFTVADHDAEDRATLRAEGIPTLAADKRVSVGIEAVGARLVHTDDDGAPLPGHPRLFILRDARAHPADPDLKESGRPTSTAEEIPGYVYPSGQTGKALKEAPVKTDDHGCDTMRYAVMAVDNPTRAPSASASLPI